MESIFKILHPYTFYSSEKMDTCIQNPVSINIPVNNNTTIIMNHKNSTNIKKKYNYNHLTFWYPDESDSLFWCLFIIKHGERAYLLRNDRSVLFEKALKIDYVEKLNVEKSFYSKELEKNLVFDQKMNIDTFLLLFEYEKKQSNIVKEESLQILSDNYTSNIENPSIVIKYHFQYKKFGLAYNKPIK